MPRPPHIPGLSREVTRIGGRARNLERRYPAVRFLPVVFDGLGAELVTGIWGDESVHFDGIIVRWRLLAIEEGDIQIDIWKADFASFPPTVADSITGSDTPTLSGTDHDESTALTGWTTAITGPSADHAGDTLRFNIDSVSGITKATLELAIAA